MPANTLIKGLKEAIVVAEKYKADSVETLIEVLKVHLHDREIEDEKLQKLWEMIKRDL